MAGRNRQQDAAQHQNHAVAQLGPQTDALLDRAAPCRRCQPRNGETDHSRTIAHNGRMIDALPDVIHGEN
ncbi:MAG: hypothetical protein WDN69_32560 [Aliidongia sp.]